MTGGGPERIFKTALFAKAARKVSISDKELCKAIDQVRKGQADDLGGGVFKKRLSNNQYRSIILARGGVYWVYELLFAKQNRANIAEDELKRFKQVAKVYAELPPQQVRELVADGDWIEICEGELERES